MTEKSLGIDVVCQKLLGRKKIVVGDEVA